MNKFSFTIFVLWVTICYSWGQARLYVQTGASFSDHLNTAIGVNFSNRNFLSVNTGTDFFVETRTFANISLKYEKIITHFSYKKWNPGYSIGIGYTIFSDINYRWKLLHATPCLSISRQINSNFILSFSGGLIVSRELSVERLELHDIGWYRHFLPELNISIKYTICAIK